MDGLSGAILTILATPSQWRGDWEDGGVSKSLQPATERQSSSGDSHQVDAEARMLPNVELCRDISSARAHVMPKSLLAHNIGPAACRVLSLVRQQNASSMREAACRSSGAAPNVESPSAADLPPPLMSLDASRSCCEYQAALPHLKNAPILDHLPLPLPLPLIDSSSSNASTTSLAILATYSSMSTLSGKHFW